MTKTTTQAITVAKEYTVTVNGGTGNGKYVAGQEVTISAFVSSGRKFKEWQGAEGLYFTGVTNKNSATATFTMPAHDVTITAVTGPAEYYVSVSGGSGTGMYEAGAIVTIVADPPEAGKQFKTWVVGDGKVLRFTESNITSSTAKFFMPGEAVRIYASYEDIPVTTYTVSFAANGGTGTMSDVTGVSGEYTLPTCTFTAPSGKQFKAWSVGGVEKAVGDKITVTADTTVTAVWETIPVGHTHNYGADWKFDSVNHWKECSCADKDEVDAHSFKWVVDKEATETEKGSKHEECTVCGYKKDAVEIPATGTPKTGDSSNMLLWAALLLAGGLGTFGTVAYSKKRKEDAE